MNNEQAKTPQFKVGDEVQIRNPHHDWDNGMKKISKVLVERARYVLADDSHETSWPESALKPYTLASEPTPWTLPPPPAGMKWHREDWEEAELPQGWRPLLDGELPQHGDLNGDKDSWAPRTCEFDVPVTSQKDGSGYIFAKHKTPRPLPQSAEPVAEDDEKPSLELMTASRNEYYEMYAAQRSYAMGLESERDQLRKELEEAERQKDIITDNQNSFYQQLRTANEKLAVLTTENAALKQSQQRLMAVTSAIHHLTGCEDARDEVVKVGELVEELTRLRSQFRWTPISERLPTKKDAIDGLLWMRTKDCGDVRHRHWEDASSFDLWMTPILPPAPSPETEEQTSRKQFEEIMIQRGTSIERDPVDGDHYAIARTQQDWKLWQRCREWAAKQSTGGQA